MCDMVLMNDLFPTKNSISQGRDPPKVLLEQGIYCTIIVYMYINRYVILLDVCLATIHIIYVLVSKVLCFLIYKPSLHVFTIVAVGQLRRRSLAVAIVDGSTWKTTWISSHAETLPPPLVIYLHTYIHTYLHHIHY